MCPTNCGMRHSAVSHGSTYTAPGNNFPDSAPPPDRRRTPSWTTTATRLHPPSSVGGEACFLVLHTSPQPLHEHVVDRPPLAVHADRDPRLLQPSGERQRRELHPLVRVEELRRRDPQRLFQGLQAEPASSVFDSRTRFSSLSPAGCRYQLVRGKPINSHCRRRLIFFCPSSTNDRFASVEAGNLFFKPLPPYS